MLISYLVILLRLVIPLTILRWPLAGGLASMLGDGVDVMVFEAFPRPLSFLHYHVIDKFLDTYYLFFEFLVVRKWKDSLARKTGSVLFIWRLVGYLLVQTTGNRDFFFYSPNIFEFFFLYYLVAKKFNPKFKFNKNKLLTALLIVGIPNIVKEYFMHFLEFETWAFFRDRLFFWLY